MYKETILYIQREIQKEMLMKLDLKDERNKQKVMGIVKKKKKHK